MAVSQFVDNFACLLGAAYNTGSGSVTLQTGYGATLASRLTQIGSAGISVDSPLRFTLIEQSANGVISPTTKFAIYLATSLSGDVLSGVTVAEGTTDQQFAINDVFAVLWTAGGQKELADIARTSPTDASVVHKTGDETIAGTKTFSTTIVGSISGNAATVTNGVYTSGSYANPSWITSLAGSKVSGDIAGNAANVSGIVAIANGGTGTASPGLVAGSNVTITGTWPNQTVAAAGTAPGGSTGQLQYNNAGAFAGAAWSTIAASGTLLGITAGAVADVPVSIIPVIGTATITNVAIASGVATVTTSAAHGFVAGRLVVISGATPSGLNSRWTIISVPSSTTFTLATSAGDSASAASGGTASSVTSTGSPLQIMDAGSVAGVRINPGAGAVTVATGGTSTGYIPTYHIETENNAAQADGTTFYRGWMSYNITRTRNRDAARIALRAGSSSTARDAAAIDLGIFGSGGTLDFYCGGNHGGAAMTRVLALTSSGANFPVNLTLAGTAGAFLVGSTNAADSNAVVRIGANSSGTGKLLVLQRNGGAGAASILEIQNSDQGSANIFSRIDGNYRWQIGSGTMSGAMLGVLADAAATPVLNVAGTASQSGALVTLAGESSTTARQPMGVIDATWSVSTHASRLADLVLSTSGYNGNHEAIRFRDTGAISQPIIPIANVRDAADDAAAAALSPVVPVGGLYRTGSILKIRVS